MSFNPLEAILSDTKEIQPKVKFSKAELSNFRINHLTKVPPLEPVIKIAGANFAVKGDISVVGGLPKAGKTAISVYMLASAFLSDDERLSKDTLQISTIPHSGGPIIYVDTEQSTGQTNKLRQAICSVIGCEREPENLFIFNIRKLATSAEKMQFIEGLFEHYQDAYLWIIDGLADLLDDPNNTKESFAIISNFMAKTESLNTSVVFYLHENPGSNKLRGNLGSEIERKCTGAITVKKDRDRGYHCIEARMLRGSSDFSPIFFRWDNELGRMVSLNASAIPKDTAADAKLQELAKAAFGDTKTIGSYATLAKQIVAVSMQVEQRIKPISDRTAKERIKLLLDKGCIVKNDDATYSLKTIETND